MRVALYIRVSTLDQNPELQRQELEAYASRHQWQVVKVFEDRASGADPRRPALERLIEAARAGSFEAVLVWKLDRFGRSVMELLGYLRTLETEGVRFIAITQGIDTDRRNPATQFFLTTLAAVAEFERELTCDRVKAGLARYRSDQDAGRVGTTVHSRTGKDLAPGRPRRLVDMARTAELRRQGLSIEKISKLTGVPIGTVYRRLKESEATAAAGSSEKAPITTMAEAVVRIFPPYEPIAPGEPRKGHSKNQEHD